MKKNLSLLLGVAAAALTLLPPYIIGTGDSALALQAVQHWSHGGADRFVWLHAHWLWLPYAIALITQKPMMSLMIFRAIMMGVTACFFARTVERIGHGDRTTTLLAVATLFVNVTVSYLLHTFSTPLLTLFAAVTILYLLTSEKTTNHRIAALVFGLSMSIGFWPFVLMLAVMTVGLNLHHQTYTLRSRDTLMLALYAIAGLASYLMLEVLLFGTDHLGMVLLPQIDKPREINLIAQGIVIAIASTNILLAYIFKRGGSGLARDFQSAFVILIAFFVLNIFAREQMLHAAIIAVVCLVVVAADKREGKSMFLGISLGVNLALFFLLPRILPDPQIALTANARTRSSSDVSLSYYGSEDVFSFAKIREQAAGEKEIRELLSHERIDSTLVLATPGTDYWFDAGTLAVMFNTAPPFQGGDRGVVFGGFYGNPINRVKINGLVDTAFINPPHDRPYLAVIFEKQFAHEFIDSAMPPTTIIHESERFQYLSTCNDPNARRALIDRLIALQYHSRHH